MYNLVDMPSYISRMREEELKGYLNYLNTNKLVCGSDSYNQYQEFLERRGWIDKLSNFNWGVDNKHQLKGFLTLVADLMDDLDYSDSYEKQVTIIRNYLKDLVGK